MGLADLIFGTQNPFSQFVDTNQNKIAGIGAGLASGQNISAGLAAAAQGAQQGGAADRAYAIQVADQKSRLDQINYERTLQQNALALQADQRKAAANWAIKMGHPEWAGAAMAGGISMGDMFGATRPVNVSADGYLASPSTGLPLFDTPPQNQNVPPPGPSSGSLGPNTAPIGSFGGAPQAAPAMPPPSGGLYRAPTPQERVSYGLKDGDPYAINIATGKPVYTGNPTSVNINNQGESSYASQRGKDLAGSMADIQNKAISAYTTKGQLGVLDSALSQSPQGWGGDTLQNVRKAAAAFGINTGNLSGGDLVNSISNQLALQLRNPANGGGMPGSLSDADRAFLSNMVPSLTNVAGGNKLIVQAAEAVEQRKIDIAKMATKYAKDHGQIDDGFFQQVADYSDANPLFDSLNKQLLKAGVTPAADGGTGNQPQAPVTATNPQTGQRLMLQDGKWVPLQ